MFTILSLYRKMRVSKIEFFPLRALPQFLVGSQSHPLEHSAAYILHEILITLLRWT